jgi:hypothetical protein
MLLLWMRPAQTASLAEVVAAECGNVESWAATELMEEHLLVQRCSAFR